MLSFTTVGMDKFTQRLPPDDRVDLAAILPTLGSSCGGSSDAHGSCFSIGSNLTSSLSTGNTCGPQIGSCSYRQSSYPGKQHDLATDSDEFEEESTARMQSLVPSGLLQDDGREYQDSLAMFPSEGETQTSYKETVGRHEGLLWRGVHQNCASNDNPGAYFPIPDMVFQHEEARRIANKPALPAWCVHGASHNASLSFFSGSQQRGVGTVNPQMINEEREQFRKTNLRDMIEHEVSRKQLEEVEASYRDCVMESMRDRRIRADSAADLSPFAERENVYHQERFLHEFRQMANNIDQSCVLQNNSEVLTVNEALARLRNPTCQQGHPTSNAELEKARNDRFVFERLRQEVNWLILDARRHAILINAELSHRNGFSSPQPTTVDDVPIRSAAGTSTDSTRASIYSAALGPRSRDLKQETSSLRSRSVRNTPEKKLDGYPCNPFSPPTRKSTTLSSSPATKALIAQGAKSISVILKPEHSVCRGRSSYPASPLSTGSTPDLSPGSESLSPIRPRRLNMSNTDALQLIPMENPSVELDVCNQGQFKTELCNNWQEAQWCRYGEHCRFAHGVKELRCVLRHHRYKSVPCRMIMSGKECIYGHRCHYRHSLTEEELSLISEARVISRTSL